MYTKGIALSLILSLLVTAPLQAIGNNNADTVIEMPDDQNTTTHADNTRPTLLVGGVIIGALLLYTADRGTSYYDLHRKTLPIDETVTIYKDDIGISRSHSCDADGHLPCVVSNPITYNYCEYSLEKSYDKLQIIEECGTWKGSTLRNGLRNGLTWLRHKVIGQTEKEMANVVTKVAASLDHDNEKEEKIRLS